jgi:SnoaL-like domain
MTTTVERYFAMWNETDPARRQAVIDATFTPDAHYVDPLLEAHGSAALNATVSGFHTQYPEHRFSIVGDVDSHHDRARWGWQLVGPDSAAVACGVDFAVMADDGRLRQVTGFFAPATGS